MKITKENGYRLMATGLDMIICASTIAAFFEDILLGLAFVGVVFLAIGYLIIDTLK